MPRNIFFIFLAVGIAIAAGSGFYYASNWMRASEARHWPTTRATIEASSVENHVNTDTNGRITYTYYPRIAYTYRVAGRLLHGERIWLTGNDFYNDRAGAVAFVQDYQVGQSVPVIYDPAHPGQPALVVENPPWEVLLATAFGLGWIGLSVWFRRQGSRPMKRRLGVCRSCGARLPFAEFGPTPTLAPVGLTAAPQAGPAHGCPRCGTPNPLNSVRNRSGVIIFLLAIALIWAAGLYLMFAM
jgi:hypothetical protein